MTLTEVAAVMNLAGLGIVAYLLLTKVEARLAALERAVNRFVVVNALDLVARSGTSEGVKREARALIRAVGADAAAKGEPSLYQEREE